MKVQMNKLLLMSAGFMLLAVTAKATPQIYVSQDGGTTPFAGWAVDGQIAPDAATGVADAGTGATPPAANTGGAGVNVDGQTAVQITADTSGNTIPQTDVIFTTDSLLTGNFNSYGANNTDLAGVAFDFYAGGNGDGTGAPSSLGVYLQSGTEVWYYAIPDATIVDGWETYYASFDSSGWYGFTDNTWTTSASDFQSALANVTAVGVYVGYLADTAGQVYGLDDFGLTVPEPETYMILGMALLSVAVVFRKRITDSLAEARAMLQV